MGTKRILKILFWLLIWAAGWVAIWTGVRRADQAFEAFIQEGNTVGVQNALQLLPSSVDFFAYSPRIREDWKEFKASHFFGHLRENPEMKAVLEKLKWSDQDLNELERWLTRFWGPELVLGYASKDRTLYLLSPLGRRQACIKWMLDDMVLSPSMADLRIQYSQVQGHSVLNITGEKFCPPQINVQFYPVQGVAVMAIGPKSFPMEDVFKARDDVSVRWMNQEAHQRFFNENSQSDLNAFGWTRLDPEVHKYIQEIYWTAKKTESQLSLSFQLSMPQIQGNSQEVTEGSSLLSLKLEEDPVVVVSHTDELRAFWNLFKDRLPTAWTRPVEVISMEVLPEEFRNIWKPVFDKVGDQFLLSMGKPVEMTEKLKLQIPRLALAVTFSNADGLFKSMEATVLKCNQKASNNLILRKLVSAQGEYYAIKTKESDWLRKYGLRDYPVASCQKNLLLIAPTPLLLDRLLGLGAQTSDSVQKMSGFTVWMKPSEVSNTLQTLFFGLGFILNPKENSSVPAAEVMGLGEVLEFLKDYPRVQLNVTHSPGVCRLRWILQNEMK